MARRFALAVALLVGVAIALWLLRVGKPGSEPRVVGAVEPGPPRAALPTELPPGAAVPPELDARAEQPEPAAAETPAASEPVDDQLTRSMANQAYAQFGSRFVDHLVSQGLARADGEAIVAELMLATVACSLETLEEQAAAQGVSVNAIRSAVEVAFTARARAPVVAGVDVSRVLQQVMPCALTSLERSGIPPATALQLLHDEYDQG